MPKRPENKSNTLELLAEKTKDPRPVDFIKKTTLVGMAKVH